MKILGLDSATWTANAGVVDGDRILAEESAAPSASHAVSLLGLIEAVLGAARLRVSALDLLAVSIGPGSFTGLRVGVSMVKGLSLATGVPVVGVPTLEALAYAAGNRPAPICAALDARKGEMYMAAFGREAGVLQPLIGPVVVSLDEFVRRLPVPCTVVGDGVEVYADRLNPLLDTRVDVVPFAVVSPRGSVIAVLGRRRFEAVGPDALDTLEPVYVRPSEAERKRTGGGPAPPRPPETESCVVVESAGRSKIDRVGDLG